MNKRIHIIVGDTTAVPLQEAIKIEEELAGELFVIKDCLHLGTLHTPGLSFSEGRSRFWQSLQAEQMLTEPVDDLERLMQLSSRLSNGEDIDLWFWMAANPADVAAYYWLLHYLKKHQGKLSVLNAIGLPFLDENRKLFYAEYWSLLPPKEFIKARKLARVVTPAEWETDADEWQRMHTENAGMRLLSGGKSLRAAELSAFDKQLLLYCKSNFQKGTRIVQQVMTKHQIPTGDVFLMGRLQALADEGILERQKSDFKLAGNKESKTDEVQSAATATDERQEA